MVNNLQVDSMDFIKNQSSGIADMLIIKQNEILNLLGYDMSLTMLFNNSFNIAMIRTVSVKDERLSSLQIPRTIFINKRTNLPIKRLVETRDILENHLEDYKLVEEMESELYIPLFGPADLMGLPSRLIGCLYLGSAGYKKVSLSSISSFKVSNIIMDISRLLLFKYVKLKEQEHLMDLTSLFVDILGKKELYLPSHSFNVASLAKEIGIALGYSDDKLRELALAGLLHDIGKTMVDSNLLRKSDKLSEEEYEKVKKHSIYGESIARYLLKGNFKFEKIPRIIKHHHERYDGTGYPDGLEKESVPFESYIIGIADAVDAMMMERPYKKAYPLDKVLEELYANKGKQFHPQLVDIMVTRISKAQKQVKKELYSGISSSSLILNLGDEYRILEGTLFNYGSYYVFEPFADYDVSNIDLSNINHIEIVVKGVNNLNYYEVKLEDLEDRLFYISSIQLVPSPNCFSLNWTLKGLLYEADKRAGSFINIVRIGGDSMLFYIHRDMIKEEVKYGLPLKVKILFEDSHEDITGVIVRSYNLGANRYFDFKYTNIPDSKRDSIYRQLFRKQMELRKAIARYS